MYRFQKFARKHKPALATASAIALCLILGTTVSAWQAVRATTAEAQANASEQKANANAAQAQEKAKEATEQRDDVKALNEKLQAANEKLQATQSRLQDTLYAAHMNLAHNAWETGGLSRMLQLLEQYRPKPGATDLRGFEWYYLQRLNHSDLFTLTGHTDSVWSVAFSPDGKRLASASSDKKVKLWDAQSDKELLTLVGHEWISDVTFSPDGKRLASGSNVWDSHSGQQLLTLQRGQWIMAFSPDGKRVAGSGVRNKLTVWDAQTGAELLACQGHTSYIRSVAFSPDGKYLASGARNSVAKIWDAQTGQELHTLTGHIGSVRALS
jgi:WD40 repeat protein